MNPIKILHTTTTIGKSSFGIGQISVSLASAQHDLNNDVSIWCLDNKENILWASEKHGFPSNFIMGFELAGPKKLWFSPDIKKKARISSRESLDIIHQHGIWTGASSATLIFAREKKIPTIVAPHGSLNKWVLNLSAWKKKIALASYERANLKLASCLHATSENEIRDFRDFGLKNPIAYIGNGIQEKYLNITGNAERFREQYSISRNQRILLFMARISPKKGLIMLINAINLIREEFRDWQLIIAGVDEFNHKKDVAALISELHLEDKIKIIGSLFDQSKNDAFAAAELFILPSYSEGSPMVILDSLAAGVPVITTKASSWADLNEYKCGWWTDINASAIGLELKAAITKNSEDLRRMGENGKMLIASKYTWRQLAQKTIKLYGWLLGYDDQPDFTVID
jgi:glycosyltransferase involved in cell wall biosynthesis